MSLRFDALVPDGPEMLFEQRDVDFREVIVNQRDVVDYLSEDEVRDEVMFVWVGEEVVDLLGCGWAGAHVCCLGGETRLM
jgi:hypothetical protein